MNLAQSTIAKVARHKWKVKIVGQRYLVSRPTVALQKLKKGKWRTIARSEGNSAGVLVLKSRPSGKYRLVYRTDSDRGLRGSTSRVFKNP